MASEAEKPQTGPDDDQPDDDQPDDERSDDDQPDDEQPAAEKTGGGSREQQITAPSLGPNTVIEREPVEERLARHEQSEVDARGKDKRRSVVGNSYGPSKTRQATLYGIAVGVVVLLAIGGKLLADKLDQPPDHITAKAPWAQPDAPQRPPEPLQ
jgi:hypothetical protein